MIKLLALFMLMPSLLFAGQGMGPGPGMPASAGGGGSSPETILPTADTSGFDTFTGCSETGLWDCVDDSSDSTYLSNGGTVQYAYFDFSSVDTAGKTISKVTIHMVALDSGTSNAIRMMINELDGNRPTLTASFATYTTEFTLNPADSQAWEPSDLTTFTAGVRNFDTTTAQVSQFWVTVDFT